MIIYPCLTVFFRPVLEHLEIRSRFSVECYSQKVHRETTYLASTRLDVNDLIKERAIEQQIRFLCVLFKSSSRFCLKSIKLSKG